MRAHFVRYLYYRGEADQDRVRAYFEDHPPHDEGLPRLRRLPHGRLVHALPDLLGAGRQEARDGNSAEAIPGDARTGAPGRCSARGRPQAGGGRPGVSPVARPDGRCAGRREAAAAMKGLATAPGQAWWSPPACTSLIAPSQIVETPDASNLPVDPLTSEETL